MNQPKPNATLFIIINIIVDLLYVLINPRIRTV